MPSDERGARRAKPDDGLGDLLRLAKPPQRVLGGHLRRLLAAMKKAIRHLGADHPWRYRVDPDALVSILDSRGVREANHPMFARVICRSEPAAAQARD